MTRLKGISRRSARTAAALATLVICLAPLVAPAQAATPDGGQFPPAAEAAPAPVSASPLVEVKEALIKLPLAAALGAILALRPRHRGRAKRNALVIQTQIMLAVVAAVIMLVVGQSLARAFGIVGAANLIRYRSTIDDPKEAVVMLCALAAGLAAGVGLYVLAPLATVFMALVLWVVEFFEPTAHKNLELSVEVKNAADFRPKLEDVMRGFRLEFELLTETEDELGYSISAPLEVHTRDISDTIRLIGGNEEVGIEWDEKKTRK